MKQMLRKVNRLLLSRRGKPWSEVSTFVLCLIAIPAYLEQAFFGYVLVKFAPGFFELANTTPIATWASWPFVVCAVLLSLIAVQFAIWSALAKQTGDVLRARLFPA